MSRIIKSQAANDGSNPELFVLRTIGINGVSALPASESDAFVPVKIALSEFEDEGFVPTSLYEIPENTAEDLTVIEEEETPETLEPPPPPGIFLEEEELDKRLRESYESGLQDGKSLAERGLLNVFNSLRSASEGLHAMRERVLRESEDELLKLIVLVARKVILREVDQDQRILQNVIQAATSKLSERDEVVIRLNPDDYATTIAHQKNDFNDESVADRMRFKADPTLLPGFCKVETEMGVIDATLEAQLDEIYRRLLEERGTSQEAGA